MPWMRISHQGYLARIAATVSGAANTAVTWSVVESGGGTVNSSGLYTAPSTAGTYHVKVTSAADTTKSAQATVTVMPNAQVAPQTVVISPLSGRTFVQGRTLQFTASVLPTGMFLYLMGMPEDRLTEFVKLAEVPPAGTSMVPSGIQAVTVLALLRGQ